MGTKKSNATSILDRNQLVMDHIHLVKFVVARLNISLPPGVTKDDYTVWDVPVLLMPLKNMMIPKAQPLKLMR